ncbi:hypothetical protein BVRB_2g044430 isoform A [Beta vulgaris subsp. vulgaris]|uniref:Cation/H+ exchanger domain-containing protein n=1 Tax=Beta vulgaris subsp. vulgaris TaxID=3555 RepID=A0A0J8BHF7_BETVV|nr:hypothetical protein BVRB_2g044430 isoform A [Beta vulgaris subsp. vulgaris]
MFCGLGIPVAFLVVHHFHAADLKSSPDHALLILWATQCPMSHCNLAFQFFQEISREMLLLEGLRAAGRGLLGLFAGVFVFALGAISLGAPVGSKYAQQGPWLILSIEFCK